MNQKKLVYNIRKNNDCFENKKNSSSYSVYVLKSFRRLNPWAFSDSACKKKDASSLNFLYKTTLRKYFRIALSQQNQSLLNLFEEWIICIILHLSTFSVAAVAAFQKFNFIFKCTISFKVSTKYSKKNNQKLYFS